MQTESQTLLAPIKDMLSRGISKEYKISNELKHVRQDTVLYSPKTVRVTETKTISPHLTIREVTAAIIHNGGDVEDISNNAKISKFGVEQLDIRLNNLTKSKLKEKFSLVELSKFGNARLLGSPDTNVLFLTTEKEGPITVRSGMKTDQLDAARAWLNNQGVNDTHETLISQFELGPMTQIESVVFIPRSR